MDQYVANAVLRFMQCNHTTFDPAHSRSVVRSDYSITYPLINI